ncbi:hypothetical protein INR49_019044 [Caranx melampygus]|nr:hypothetical protein INR49_019044 [Caranx melampygus]
MRTTLGSCNLSTARQQRGSIIQDSAGTVELLVQVLRTVRVITEDGTEDGATAAGLEAVNGLRLESRCGTVTGLGWAVQCSLTQSAGGERRTLRRTPRSSQCCNPTSTANDTAGARTGKRKRGRMNEERDRREKVIEELLIQSLQRPPALLPPPPPPPPAWIEEERFLSSLAPSLHRLPPQQREYVKYHIHKLIYESTTITLNLDLLE